MAFCSLTPFSKKHQAILTQPGNPSVGVATASFNTLHQNSPPNTLAHKDRVPPNAADISSSVNPHSPVASSSTVPTLDILNPPKIEDIQANTVPAGNVDPTHIENIREKCPSFRILIIGRANSGKTTIARQICNATEEPLVYVVRNGKRVRVPASELKAPSLMRGYHDIHLEITYSSNPGFTFHDSMGFEAGSTTEVDEVWNFIEERLQQPDLANRLHAIWLCIPTDSTRVAFGAELEFFRRNTGGIPVVLVFTKWDGRIVRTCSDLKAEGMTFTQATEVARARAQETLEKHYIPVFRNTPHPPASYAILGDMDKPGASCSELSVKTAATLSDGVLKKLFISVQTHNLEICMENGIREALSKEVLSSDTSGDMKYGRMVSWTILWFPHVYENHDYSDQIGHGRTMRMIRAIFNALSRFNRREQQHGYTAQIHEGHSFYGAFIASKQAFSSPRLQVLNFVACVVIAATRSFEKKTTHISTNSMLKICVDEYLASPQYTSVKEAIQTTFSKYADVPSAEVSNDTVNEICDGLHKICSANLLK